MTDHELIAAIYAEMNGAEWNADTLDAIAALMGAAGYEFADPNEGAGDAVEWQSLEPALRHMATMDEAGDSYVVESVKLASGVTLRAKAGPGFDVVGHLATGVSLEATGCARFFVPSRLIASVTVLPL